MLTFWFVGTSSNKQGSWFTHPARTAGTIPMWRDFRSSSSWIQWPGQVTEEAGGSGSRCGWFRCYDEELANGCYGSVLSIFFHFCVLTGFGIVRYDRNASRYHIGVYERKRRDLVVALDAILSPLFLGQLKNLHKSCLVAFKQELLEGLRGDDYSFVDVVTKARETCEQVFTTGAKEALVEGTDWTWEEELELLKEEVKIVSDQCRKDETKKMLNQIEVCSIYVCKLTSLIVSQRNVKKNLSEPVELRLSKASKTMWDQILRIFKDILDKAETSYLSKAKSTHTAFVDMIYDIWIVAVRFQLHRGRK